MSSFSKRQGTERYASQRETTKQKEVPHAGLVMLKADGSNQVAWTSALNDHVEKTWGTYGAAVNSGAVIVRAVPDPEQIQADFPALTAANVQKQYLDDVSEYKRQLKRLWMTWLQSLPLTQLLKLMSFMQLQFLQHL